MEQHMDQVRQIGGDPKIHPMIRDAAPAEGTPSVGTRAASIQVFEDDGVEASGIVLDKRH